MAKEKPIKDAQVAPEAVSSTEAFIKKNLTILSSVVAGVIVIALVAFLFSKYVYAPKKAEALGQLYPAETLFAQGQYEAALEGNGNVLGFAEVIDEYGRKAGAAAYLYAGVCELQLGNYAEAIKYLKKYNGKDNILAGRALACTGDAYSALEDYNKALNYYVKAAKTSNNLYSAAYLLKAGVVAEELGKPQQALSYYKQIKEQYPMSVEGLDIEKYISRIEK